MSEVLVVDRKDFSLWLLTSPRLALPCLFLPHLALPFLVLPRLGLPCVICSTRYQTIYERFPTDVTQTLLELCCGTCWQIRTTPPANTVKDFFESEPEDTGLSLPYITSAFDQQYGHDYVPIIKDPSSAFVKKKKGLVYIWYAFIRTRYTVWDNALAKGATMLSISSTSLLRSSLLQLLFLQTWCNPCERIQIPVPW